MKRNNFFRRAIAFCVTAVLVATMLTTVSVNATDTVAEITFGNVISTAGEEVLMPIVIENNTGIATYRFRISYDSEHLEFLSVENSEAFSSGTLVSDINPDTKAVTFLWYSVTNVTANGEMAFLRFRIADNFRGEMPIDVTCREQDMLNQDSQPISYTVNEGVVSAAADFTGNVTAYDKPLNDAIISLIKNGIEQYSTRTDNGNFMIAYVLPGRYTVKVSLDGYVTKSYELDMGLDNVQQAFELMCIGDVKVDGEANNKDLALLMQFINGWKVEINTECSDFNLDGKFNNKDYVLLMRYINGW